MFGFPSAIGSVLQDLTPASRLARYESLLRTLDELSGLADPAAVARLIRDRLDSIVPSSACRLLVMGPDGYLTVDTWGRGADGSQSVQESTVLSGWDAQVWNRGEGLTIEPGAADDGSGGHAPLPAHLRGQGTSCIRVIPVFRGRARAGVLCVAMSDPSPCAFDPERPVDLPRLVAAQLVERVSGMLLRAAQGDEATQRASRDPLTGALNGDSMRVQAEAMLSTSRRQGMPISVLLAEIDDFHGLSRRLGAAASDDVLRDLVPRLRTLTRDGDSFGRLEEGRFMFALYPCGPDEAVAVAERIRRGIEAAGRADGGAPDAAAALTVSVGASSSTGRGVVSIETLVDLAERSLAQAMTAGGNRSVLNRDR